MENSTSAVNIVLQVNWKTRIDDLALPALRYDLSSLAECKFQPLLLPGVKCETRLHFSRASFECWMEATAQKQSLCIELITIQTPNILQVQMTNHFHVVVC